MFYYYLLIVTIIAMAAGFLTGLLSIGGGLIVFPAYLYIMPLLGFRALSIHEATGIAATQIIIGSLFSFLSHRENIKLNKKDLVSFGVISGLGAFCGAVLSVFLPEKLLLLFYFAILVIAILSMTVLKPSETKAHVAKNKYIVPFLCYFSSLMSGSLGLGGAVLYIPTFRYFYGLSTKNCIGLVSFLVFCVAVMSFTGKILTHQVPYNLLAFIFIGSFVGAKFGAYISKKLSSQVLKRILLFIIVVAAIRVLISILS